MEAIASRLEAIATSNKKLLVTRGLFRLSCSFSSSQRSVRVQPGGLRPPQKRGVQRGVRRGESSGARLRIFFARVEATTESAEISINTGW